MSASINSAGVTGQFLISWAFARKSAPMSNILTLTSPRDSMPPVLQEQASRGPGRNDPEAILQRIPGAPHAFAGPKRRRRTALRPLQFRQENRQTTRLSPRFPAPLVLSPRLPGVLVPEGLPPPQIPCPDRLKRGTGRPGAGGTLQEPGGSWPRAALVSRHLLHISPTLPSVPEPPGRDRPPDHNRRPGKSGPPRPC